MKSIFFSGLLVLSLLLILSEVSNGAVQCGTVTVKAAQCVGFATGKSPKPAAACCTGLQELAQIVKSVDDKRAACQCLRNSAKNLGIVDRYLTQLPALCKINVGFPVSTTTNCQSIH